MQVCMNKMFTSPKTFPILLYTLFYGVLKLYDLVMERSTNYIFFNLFVEVWLIYAFYCGKAKLIGF
jgi:hypothetical protein